MILTNVGILKAIKAGTLYISGLENQDPTQRPFNTTSVDLCLGDAISCPKEGPAAFDLRKPGVAQYLQSNSRHHTITEEQPYPLKPNNFVLAQTREEVGFPIKSKGACYCSRVEGKAPSLAVEFSSTLRLLPFMRDSREELLWK